MKLTIKNRSGNNISVLYEEPIDQPNHVVSGLGFVMHGLGGFKEQAHLQAMAEALREHGYSVVRFDTTNSMGESDGDLSDATITNYYADLEDVIAWARLQPWHREPFIVAGHSLGGICSALFAERFPDHVKALAPIATVVSGVLSLQTHTPEYLEQWKKTGWMERLSQTTGKTMRLKWSHMEDRLQYDLLPKVANLTMPVLMVVGEQDELTPPNQQQILYDKIPGKKELHIVPGAKHGFYKEEHVRELKKIFSLWLSTLH